MKTVILAGGKGLRIFEETKLIPKPMIKIGGIPIILHIMNIYKQYGFNDLNDNQTEIGKENLQQAIPALKCIESL